MNPTLPLTCTSSTIGSADIQDPIESGELSDTTLNVSSSFNVNDSMQQSQSFTPPEELAELSQIIRNNTNDSFGVNSSHQRRRPVSSKSKESPTARRPRFPSPYTLTMQFDCTKSPSAPPIEYMPPPVIDINDALEEQEFNDNLVSMAEDALNNLFGLENSDEEWPTPTQEFDWDAFDALPVSSSILDNEPVKELPTSSIDSDYNFLDFPSTSSSNLDMNPIEERSKSFDTEKLKLPQFEDVIIEDLLDEEVTEELNLSDTDI